MGTAGKLTENRLEALRAVATGTIERFVYAGGDAAWVDRKDSFTYRADTRSLNWLRLNGYVGIEWKVGFHHGLAVLTEKGKEALR